MPTACCLQYSAGHTANASQSCACVGHKLMHGGTKASKKLAHINTESFLHTGSRKSTFWLLTTTDWQLFVTLASAPLLYYFIPGNYKGSDE